MMLQKEEVPSFCTVASNVEGKDLFWDSWVNMEMIEL
jgi:hypothetical protein